MIVKVLLLSLLLSVALADYMKKAEATSDYKAWKLKHGHSYSASEDTYRQFLFRQRATAVKAHNENAQHSWKQGLNQFSALTQEEFEQTYLGSQLD